MLDIRGDSSDIVAARLSNFTARKFVFRGVSCSGIEALLQSLKIEDPKKQVALCRMPSRLAWKKGQEFNSWKESQILWWDGKPYHRESKEYADLIDEIYDAAFEGDPSLVIDLLATGNQGLSHSIGKSDPTDTVLTEKEMIRPLLRLRERARKEC